MDTKIQHEDGPEGGSFFIADGDERPARMTYRRTNEHVAVFDHTFVDERFRGQGIAGKLFAEAVQWIKASGVKVVPECSYVASRFEKDPSLAEYLAE